MTEAPSAGKLTPRQLANSYAKRARDAAEISRIRAGDVMRPAIDAIAAAPTIIIDVTEGVAQAAAGQIEQSAALVAKQLQGAAAATEAIAKEREAQVKAAQVQMAADQAKTRAAVAALVQAGGDEIVAADRLKRTLLGFGLASLAALVLASGAYYLGWRSGHAEAKAEMVGDTANRLTALVTTAKDASEALATAKAIVKPLQLFAALTPQQQVDLIRIIQFNVPWPGEDVPFPCSGAGPRNIATTTSPGPRRPLPTCIVVLPEGTRVRGSNFQAWLQDARSSREPISSFVAGE